MPYASPLMRKEYSKGYYQRFKEKWGKNNGFCIDCNKKIWAKHLRCGSCSNKKLCLDRTSEQKATFILLMKKANTNRKMSEQEKINRCNAQRGKKCPWMVERNRIMNAKFNYFRNHRNDLDFKKKLFKSCCKKPNKPEKFVIDIISENSIPLSYVGDGKVIINGLNPDFINEEHRKIVEVFGKFWHKEYAHVTYNRTEEGRKKIFDSLGYQLLILWDDELKYSNRENIINKLNNFLKC